MNKTATVRERLRDLLSKPDYLAGWLRSQSKGGINDPKLFTPADMSDCPLWHFLNHHLQGIAPDIDLQVAGTVRWSDETGSHRVNLPQWAREYVCRVDALEDEGVVTFNYLKALTVLGDCI